MNQIFNPLQTYHYTCRSLPVGFFPVIRDGARDAPRSSKHQQHRRPKRHRQKARSQFSEVLLTNGINF